MIVPTLGPERYAQSNACPWRMVRIHENVTKTVSFIGHGSNEDFRPIGTGFWIRHDRGRYFVTARHVADQISDAPFVVRVNHEDGGASFLHFDMEQSGDRWFSHQDNDVDIAIYPLFHTLLNLSILYLQLPDMCIVGETPIRDYAYVGDETYTVGLFQYVGGKRRNLAVVHTGHLALPADSDERINVSFKTADGKSEKFNAEAYLVEQQSLEGLSGAPVFVRGAYDNVDIKNDIGGVEGVILPRRRVNLLGVWLGSWKAPPDAMLMDAVGRVTVPVGMGVVAPAEKILEILEGEDMTKFKDAVQEHLDDQQAASADAIPSSEHTEASGDELLRRMLNTPPEAKE